MEYDERLGPLALLPGIWEGSHGTDVAPSDEEATYMETKTSPYRERMEFELTGQVDNHNQTLFGLRYRTTAWRIDQPDPFHEEVGYWMWDSASEILLRSFMPPRGMAILAGGTVAKDASRFTLEATAGSETFGICSSPFLLKEFKTTKYVFNFEMRDENTIHYSQTTFLKMKGRESLFDHSDQNTLTRVSA